MTKNSLPPLLAGLILCALPAVAKEKHPAHGEWDCGGMAFDLSAKAYNGDPVESIEQLSAQDYGVTLKNGYRFALFDVTKTFATWHSPESGDTFDCRRKG